MMSICLESKISNEIYFLTKLKMFTNDTKLTNQKILKEIDSNVKTLVILNSKKDSSSNAELSTGVKNSSLLSKHNAFLQQIEVINNINMNNNNEEENESMSSISMELETNLNLNELPSDDESLRFIDKVFDIKSKIKPIKNNLKSIISPLTTSKIKIKKSSKKVEPIKIEKPINYKQKEEEIIEEIDIIKKDIENKRNKIEEIKNKKKNLEKELNINKNNLNQALIKIKIIKDKIEFLQKQKDDLSTNNKKGKLFRLISINNIINNRNYCLIDNNDNSIYDKETFRK